jgi:acetolactate synthase-1/2/3 large subunit
MGFELPASIGTKVGRPSEMVWCIAGDGSFQMTVQELGTMVQDGIDVKIAIMNNCFLGMVRQWQDLFYDKNYVATPLSCPNFAELAGAYGMKGLNVTKKSDVLNAIQTAIKTPGPFVINFKVAPEENVYPMVPPGAPISEVIEWTEVS